MNTVYGTNLRSRVDRRPRPVNWSVTIRLSFREKM
jgi:hypothetical protein